MSNVYSYIRFSSVRQEEGDSVRRQTALTKDWCNRNGFVLDESLSIKDLGVSAFSGKNLTAESALGGFLDAVKIGKVQKGSYLAIERLDRLTRRDIDSAYNLWRSILKAGIKIVTVSNGIVYDEDSLQDIAKLFFALVEFATANQESQKKSDRIKSQWAERRKNVANEKLTGWCPAWLKLSEDRKSFIVDDGMRKTMLFIFTEYANGSGVHSIAQKLNASKTPIIIRRTKQNADVTTWRTYTIQHYLRNKALIGRFQPTTKVDGKIVPVGEELINYYPPILEEALFYKVQAMLDAIPPKRGRVSGDHTNLFTGKLFCPYCKGRIDVFLSYPQRGGKKYGVIRNLRCVNSFTADCVKIGWRLDEFEQTFMEFASEVKEKVNNDDVVITLEDNVSVLKQQLDDRRSRLKRFVDMVETSANVPASIMDRMNVLEVEIKSREAELVKQESSLLLSKDAKPLGMFDGAIDITDVETRKKVANAIRSTFSKIDLFYVGDLRQGELIKEDIKATPNRAGHAAVMFRKKWNIEDKRFFVAQFSSVGNNGRFTYPRIDAEIEHIPTYKLTKVDGKDAAIADLKKGMGVKEVSKKHNISVPTVKNILLSILKT